MEGDTINGFKWNLAHKQRPWAYCVLPNVAQIGKEDGHKIPHNVKKIWSKLRYFGVFVPHQRCNTAIQVTFSL